LEPTYVGEPERPIVGSHYPTENGKGEVNIMTRQLEQAMEEKSKRRHGAILLAVEGGLSRSLSESTIILEGFSATFRNGDCLITLRGIVNGDRQVCFVGADDLGSALVKASREARGGLLKWRPDKYGKPVALTR
jgi:hypothetical protein